MGAVHGERPQVWTDDHLAITVRDRPAPQGSKRHVGRGILVEQSPHVKTWREAVKAAALEATRAEYPSAVAPATYLGPVLVEVTFTLARPKGHYGTGRNAAVVKASAPGWPTSTPDVDKLQRATLDALTAAGVWKDDAQVVEITARKVYVSAGIDALDVPGAVIRVRPA